MIPSFRILLAFAIFASPDVCSSSQPNIHRLNDQLVSHSTVSVHGDLHIASISMKRLVSSALGLPASIQPGSLSMYSSNGDLHFDSTLVLCDELISGSSNVSSRILQLLSTYPSKSNDWNTLNTTIDVACPVGTTSAVTPAIFKSASGISIRGSFNASNMVWAGRSVIAWLDEVEKVLSVTITTQKIIPASLAAFDAFGQVLAGDKKTLVAGMIGRSSSGGVAVLNFNGLNFSKDWDQIIRYPEADTFSYFGNDVAIEGSSLDIASAPSALRRYQLSYA
jgi:hypothetical protein